MTRQFRFLLTLLLAITHTLAWSADEFSLPALDTFVLGKTTYAQVVEKMGNTGKVGDLDREGTKLKSLRFHQYQSGRYSSAVPAEDGLSPFRTLTCYFNDDTLVGYEGLSSYKSDSTQFDESRIDQIVKGKTTREELLALLPNPTVRLAGPFLKTPGMEVIGYRYSTLRRIGFGITSKTLTSNKSLLVYFNESNVAINSELKKQPEH